jgi:hypothetical protein
MKPKSKIRITDNVILTVRDKDGFLISRQRRSNTLTNYAASAVALALTGSAVTLPGDIAVGSGSGTPSASDAYLWAEIYGTRNALAYTNTLGPQAQYSTTWASGVLGGTTQITYTEAGLLDAPVGSASVKTGGVASGATTLPLAAGAPAVGGLVNGFYQEIYINDGVNSEYAYIASAASAGASSWTLTSGLQHSHAAGIPIVVFGGNLWAHVAINQVVISGQVLTCQWNVNVGIN